MTGSASRRAPLALIVLAAGKGTRLAAGEGAPPKVLVECLGAPLLEHVRLATAPLDPDLTVVVVGHQHERVRDWLGTSWPEAVSVLQEPQCGTGHAVRVALEAHPDFEGTILVVYGDVPQLRTEDLQALLERHRRKEAKASLLTGIVADAGSLGRVVRGADGSFREIVEAKDATTRPEILAIREFNSGLYAFDSKALYEVIGTIDRDNAQGEEYATDAVTKIAATGAVVEAVVAQETESLLGVNDGRDLAGATTLLRRRIASDHMRRGVTIVDPDTTVIEVGVEIEAGARILPFTYIQRGCRVAAGAVVGPFARLRGAAVLEEGAEVGNFVEVKKSTLGPGAKAKHLTYLGDAIIGAKVNVGCGTITANYDGVRKHPTTIKAGARIGSGTVLVAPVTVGEGAVTGAIAVVLPGRDVPAGRTAVGVPSRLLANRDDETSPGGSA